MHLSQALQQQQQALQTAQMGKMMPMGQVQQPPLSIATQMPQFAGLPTISMAGTGFTMAGTQLYHPMSPALSPMGTMPGGLPGYSPTILTSSPYGGVQSVPKLHMPQFKGLDNVNGQAQSLGDIQRYIGLLQNNTPPLPNVDASLLTINGFAVPAKLTEKRKIIEEIALNDVKKFCRQTSISSSIIPQAKLETKALKAKRPGFTDDRYNETSYYVENGLRKVYPYYFTFTTFTKGRWVGEKILDVFAREFRAHPVEEYERCILDGTLTVNYDQVDTDYRLRHNDLLANIVHRHETPVLSKPIEVVHLSEELVVLDKPCSLPVHPCGRYRHNTVVFILAKEYNLKNLRTIHRLDRLTSGLLMFGRNPRKAREMEHQIRNRQVMKEYVCRVLGEFPEGKTECSQPVEVVSYKIGVCKVSPQGKECRTEFERLSFNGKTSVVLCRPFTGRMHQIRVHLQYLGFPVMNDPLYNHLVFGPDKGKGGNIGKTDEKLISDLISIHNAENWLGMDGESGLSMFNKDDDKDGQDENTNDIANKLDTPLKPKKKCVHHNNFDPANPLSCIENNPNIPRNCTITRPPPITKPCRTPVVLRQPLETGSYEDTTPEDNELLAKNKEYRYISEKMTWDPNCYECKVRYRDPKSKDLVMYLHAWRYKGPDWQFETRLPHWAETNWTQPIQET